MPCRIRSVKPSACLMGALGLLPGRPDLSIGAASSLVPCTIGHDSGTGVTIDLGADGPLVPLGHQDDTTAGCCCPALADDALEQRPALKLRLAAVAIAIDSRRRVLLTRRPRGMRTFPGAWVMPGGSADSTDNSLVATALRELEEETGLRTSLDEVTLPLCFWESCFPVSYNGWRDARIAGGQPAHSLIAFIVVPIADEVLQQKLLLQPDECDAACWVPLEEVAGTLCTEPAGRGPVGTARSDSEESVPTDTEVRTYEATGAQATDGMVAVSQLGGVYPNACGEGIGRGHLFALRQLLARDGA